MRIEALKSAIKNIDYDETCKAIGIFFVVSVVSGVGVFIDSGSEFTPLSVVVLATLLSTLFFLYQLSDGYRIELNQLKYDQKREAEKGNSIYDVWDNDDFAMDNKMSDEELAEFKQSVELKNRAKRAGRIN
ncbi:hypothetical protein [Vibrio phage CKB-S2]|nr:hypothetical protein [Vibrio phage CKB-S2]